MDRKLKRLRNSMTAKQRLQEDLFVKANGIVVWWNFYKQKDFGFFERCLGTLLMGILNIQYHVSSRKERKIVAKGDWKALEKYHRQFMPKERSLL